MRKQIHAVDEKRNSQDYFQLVMLNNDDSIDRINLEESCCYLKHFLLKMIV